MKLSVKSSVFLTLFLLLCVHTHAQTVLENGTFEQRLKYAGELLEHKSYFSALDVLKQLQTEFPKNEESAYKLGRTYFELNRMTEAAETFRHYSQLKKVKQTEYPLAYYFYAKTQMALGDYEQAQKTFLLFAQAFRRKESEELTPYKRKFRNELKKCEKALELAANKNYNIEVTKAEGLNTGYSDFAPLIVREDSLLFASLGANEVLEIHKGVDNTPKVRMFQARKDKKGWSEIQPANFFNDPLAHTANGAFSPDGKTFYFSKCYEDNKFRKKCDIYVSKMEKGSWQKPRPLGRKINGRKYSSSQPAVGQIKRRRKIYNVLYFVSDRPGGIGGKDIWYALIDLRGKIERVANCGRGINGKYDEVTPYYNQEQQIMYFSSDSHWGAGGFDIFKSKGGGRSFSKAQNLGLPINSAYDDMYYAPEGNKNSGFLVSNRPGTRLLEGNNCCTDIFYYKEKEPEVYYISGTTVQSSTSKESRPMKIALVPTHKIQTGELAEDSVANVNQWQTDSTGRFAFNFPLDQNYTLLATQKGHKPQQFNVDSLIAKQESNRLELSINLQPLPSQEPIKLPVAVERKSLSEKTKVEDLKKETALLLDNIYFEFNKYTIKKVSYPTLEILHKFMLNNPQVKIEVAGHTDDIGKNHYNLTLSQQRAEAIQDFLIKKGIKKQRIIAKGYGESQPIVPNQHPDGSDNPVNQQRNRRIEIKIID